VAALAVSPAFPELSSHQLVCCSTNGFLFTSCRQVSFMPPGSMRGNTRRGSYCQYSRSLIVGRAVHPADDAEAPWWKRSSRTTSRWRV